MSPAEAETKKARKPTAAEGRRELHDIIRTARAMEERRLNPFHMDVSEALGTADRFFGAWDSIDDLTLDARTLNSLSRVVKMQEARLRYQAQLFHADPEAMVEKLKSFNAAKLGGLLLQCWHPAVELEQLTASALEEAMAYWQELEPIELRHRERPKAQAPAMEQLSLDDLLAKGIVPRDGFTASVGKLRDELQERGEVGYAEFIHAPTYTERVKRAYATSYLITYGYAALQRSEGSMTLRAKGEREPPGEGVSLPLVVPA
ncbi:MAG: hypothetical protein LC624_08690 [Halobacteriales archaeon]|nr:hypothetical protein [Halobacteriales archaeon]